MAGPTPDSLNANPLAAAQPLAGKGSQTPVSPSIGTQTPIGAGAPPKPLGTAGAPPTPPPLSPEEMQDMSLVMRSLSTIVLDIHDVINKLVEDGEDKEAQKDIDVEKLINGLIDKGWSINRLKKLISIRDIKPEKFFTDLRDSVVEHGLNKTIDKLKNEFKEVTQPAPAPGAPPPGGGLGAPPPSLGGGLGGLGGGGLPAPPKPGGLGGIGAAPPPGGGIGASPPPLPDLGAPKTSQVLSDINPDNQSRGIIMAKTKILIDNGELKEVTAEDSPVLMKLAQVVTKISKNVENYENAVIRLAGIRAIKTAEFEDMMSDDEEEGGMDEGPKDEKEEAKEHIEDAEKALDKAKEALGGSVEEGDELIEEGKGELEEAAGGEPKDFMAMASMIDKAREVVALGKATLRKAKQAKESAEEAGKEQMGTSGKFMKNKSPKDGPDFPGKKVEDEGKGVDEPKKPKEEKKDKEASEETGVRDFVNRVKARLEELRQDKEANLYPFKKVVTQSSEKTEQDKIQKGTASDQDKEINKEIKKQPVDDKDTGTIAPKGIGEKSPAVKTQGKATPEKNITLQTAEKLRKYSMDNLASKARLSVELAAQQQLKGLIADPLRSALVKNMIDSGINKEAAEAIVTNSYIDGYEASHQEIMKEAFETFINKDLEDFVKVAKFVKEYSVKTGESNLDENREKTASDSIALRASQVAEKESGEYTGFWKDTQKRQRGF